MVCTTCGHAPCHDGAKFCHHCGTPLRQASVPIGAQAYAVIGRAGTGWMMFTNPVANRDGAWKQVMQLTTGGHLPVPSCHEYYFACVSWSADQPNGPRNRYVVIRMNSLRWIGSTQEWTIGTVVAEAHHTIDVDVSRVPAPTAAA